MLPDDHLPRDAALFVDDGVTVTATELSRGPWDPRACHGGPVAALLVRAVEQLGLRDAGATAWQIARTTIELVRPVPVLVPMRVTAEVERPGRNVSLVAVVLRTVDDLEVARSRTLRIRQAPIELGGDFPPAAPFSPPGEGELSLSSILNGEHRAFHQDAVELRFASGAFDRQGPAQVWCRLRVPVVAGETPSGVQRVVAAADFGNGVSGALDPDVVTFLNPDLTVHLGRPPEGEWVGLDVTSHYGPLGAGYADCALHDRRGRVGRSVQSLLLAPR